MVDLNTLFQEQTMEHYFSQTSRGVEIRLSQCFFWLILSARIDVEVYLFTMLLSFVCKWDCTSIFFPRSVEMISFKIETLTISPLW